MPFFTTYKDLIFPEGRVKYLLIALIVAFLALGDILVEATGGTAFAYLHIIYIPIILSGLFFSIRGGMITGIVAGFLLGPWMPTSVVHDIAQPLSSWTIRLGFFALVGAIAGLGSSVFKAYVRELELKQITDPLTGLPNLNGLRQIFSTLIQKDNKEIVVIVIELFQMREIDQALGTEGTNLLLQQIAINLKQAIGEQGILGHLQTHQFAVLVSRQEHVSELLKRCEALSEHPYHIDNIPLFAEMRFGISRYPIDDRELSHLARKALISINVRKNQAERVSYFEKNIDDSSERNLLILHQFKNAIDNNQNLTLEYQPKVYLQTNKALGFEALVRWTDPLLGAISPEDFMPLAEETLLIQPFTRWVIETALQQMDRWNQQGLLLPVSVNFSMNNFHDSSIFETLIHLLKTYKIPPHLLQVEVTETAVALSLTTIAHALKNLRKLGIKTAIDDFGTGQASQQYLLELPIDVIKIDKIFTQSITQNSSAAAIVKNAISLAHDLKIEVISEGVETQHQYDLLKQWGCDAGQGYLIGRSMKEEEATKWLKKKGNNK